jgi:hypothetical protein
MTKLLKKIAIILPMFIAVLLLQKELDAKRIEHEEVYKERRLPDPHMLKELSLGFEGVIADYYWFKTTLYVGTEDELIDYDYFAELVDLVTTLDPNFQYPYIFGSLILSLEANDYTRSDKLLLKGFAIHGESWRFPFGLGYNSYFGHGDSEKAARYLGISARLPGHPSYLPVLASRVYYEAGDSDVAIQFLETILEETPEGKHRAVLEQRRDALKVIRYLEKMVSRYSVEKNGSPETIEELVSAGYLKEIPDDPYGGEFYLDDNYKVQSTSDLRPVDHGIHKGENND